MLLPSALSCDQPMAHPHPQKPARPKLPSFERYDARPRAQSPVVGLIASCRALHSMLGERFSSTPSPSLEAAVRARSVGSPFGDPSPAPKCTPAPRGVNKRRRNEFEEEDILTPQSSDCSRPRSGCSTPKRRRVVPLELPLGLLASDFEALSQTSGHTAPTPKARIDQEDVKMPSLEIPPTPPKEPPLPGHTWTENDDKLLVEAVLAKLNLSSRDWNDCALQLGKDKDSIGRRWRHLLGGGNIGLRRGSGRMDRVDLDIKSW